MPLPIRAIMMDAPRLQERDEHYRRLIRFAAQWGANAAVFRVTDDQGVAMRLRCLPRARREHQYTREGMRALVRYAAEHGITLIPEVESLGHSSYITKHPGFEDLAEGAAKGFVGLCVSNPKTYAVLDAVIKEVCEVFDSPYIHLGCDESVFGVCPRCKRRLKSASKHVLYARHIARLRRIVSPLGRRMIIWGDHTTNLWGDGRIYDAKAVKATPKDVIMANWDYRHTVTDVSTKELVRRGFQVLTCPALHWCRAAVFPSTLEITNVKRFVGQAHRYQPEGAFGSIITIWCPYRFISDAMWHSIAMAIRMMCEKRFDRDAFEHEFAERFHGLPKGRTLRESADHLYAAGLGLQKEFPALFFDSDTLLADARTLSAARVRSLETHAAKAKRGFQRALKTARKHRTELAACVLGADVVLEGCRRWRAARRPGGRISPAGHRALARRAAALVRRLSRDWDRARFPDDPLKHPRGDGASPRAYMLAQIESAARWSGRLAAGG